MEESILEAWGIHDRINLYLLDATPDEALGQSLELKKKNRTVWAQFAHMHNVRLMWLQASAPDLMHGLAKLETDAVGTKADLKSALSASGKAMGELFSRSAKAGKLKNFKKSVVSFLCYVVAHESHHRGQIGWTLKNTGFPLDKKIGFGMWEWGVR